MDKGQKCGRRPSIVSLASIAAPLGFSSLYLAVEKPWPGAIWLSVVVLYAMAVPLVLRSVRRTTLRP